jgi:hypothetical protein
MRPPAHDDPNAIPRNGTEVPWPELPDADDPDTGSWVIPPARSAEELSRSGRPSGASTGRTAR